MNKVSFLILRRLVLHFSYELMNFQVNIKEEEINKLITKKNVLVRQKTLRQTYSKNSFFIFSLNSKFRKTLIDIIESKAFQWVLRFFLLLNTIAFMIKYYYSDAQSSQSLEQPSFYIELVCNFYFLVEILLRILTMGLVLESKTFLREPFQIMDFIVTVARYIYIQLCLFQCLNFKFGSFLQYLSIPELKQLGLVVKMMRPFRVFNSFPGKIAIFLTIRKFLFFLKRTKKIHRGIIGQSCLYQQISQHFIVPTHFFRDFGLASFQGNE